MKKVITYGTYDLLHHGHISILKRAKSKGDWLVVGLSSDEFNKKKGKLSFQTFEERKSQLEAIRYVDEIISEDDWHQKKSDVFEHNIDLLVMGDDWKGKFNNLPCKVHYLPRTKDISTTKIKEIMGD